MHKTDIDTVFFGMGNLGASTPARGLSGAGRLLHLFKASPLRRKDSRYYK